MVNTIFLILFWVVCFVFPVNVPQSFSHELENNESHDSLLDDNKKFSGVCPQQRNTPQAPEPFLSMTNPLPSTPQNLSAGETLFKIDARPTACKVCHGFSGNGLGIIFERLQPKPRNFTCFYTMEDISDGQIFWIIKNGSPGTPMPSFGALSDEQVWQLVLYIRKFAKE